MDTNSTFLCVLVSRRYRICPSYAFNRLVDHFVHFEGGELQVKYRAGGGGRLKTSPERPPELFSHS